MDQEGTDAGGATHRSQWVWHAVPAQCQAPASTSACAWHQVLHRAHLWLDALTGCPDWLPRLAAVSRPGSLVLLEHSDCLTSVRVFPLLHQQARVDSTAGDPDPDPPMRLGPRQENWARHISQGGLRSRDPESVSATSATGLSGFKSHKATVHKSQNVPRIWISKNKASTVIVATSRSCSGGHVLTGRSTYAR